MVAYMALKRSGEMFYMICIRLLSISIAYFFLRNVSNEIRVATCFNDCAGPVSSPDERVFVFFIVQVNFNPETGASYRRLL